MDMVRISYHDKSNPTVPSKTPGLTSGVPWILGHGRFLVIAVTKDRPSSAARFFRQPTEHSSFSHRLDLKSRPIVWRPNLPVHQSPWYGPRPVFGKRTGAPPIRDSGEPMRDSIDWERRRPACRSKKASGWSAIRRL